VKCEVWCDVLQIARDGDPGDRFEWRLRLLFEGGRRRLCCTDEGEAEDVVSPEKLGREACAGRREICARSVNLWV
jgi:hypothetical protein